VWLFENDTYSSISFFGGQKEALQVSYRDAATDDEWIGDQPEIDVINVSP
jgi:CRISPR/Cas system CMR subunit Cmr6 (Cas7 group RAMP superfamily)